MVQVSRGLISAPGLPSALLVMRDAVNPQTLFWCAQDNELHFEVLSTEVIGPLLATVEVWDEDVGRDDFVGTATVDLTPLLAVPATGALVVADLATRDGSTARGSVHLRFGARYRALPCASGTDYCFMFVTPFVDFPATWRAPLHMSAEYISCWAA